MNKAVLIVCIIFTAAFGEFLDKGRHELGGGLSFAYNGSYEESAFIVSPFYNYYFHRIFSIGPIFSLTGVGDNNIETFVEMGVRLGCGKQYKKTFLYLSSGLEWGIGSQEDPAFAFPLSAGIKILLTDNFGIDPHMTFVPVIAMDDNYFNIGMAVAFFGLL
jgi:hypothetical protein